MRLCKVFYAPRSKWQSINCYLLDEDRYDDSSILQVLRYG